MSTTFKALVTRNSNGSIELAPLAGGNVPGKVEPGSEADVTIAVLRTPAQIEHDTEESKTARGVPVRKTAAAPVAEGEAADEDTRTIGSNARKTSGR